MNKRITCFASVISEIQQSDIYLTVKARLFEAPGANLNGVRVTPAFLSEIVEHQDKYVGLPLCADVKALANGNYQHLGHLYDARTGEFHSAQIGSFYQFEEEKTTDGSALIGYARILKRNKAVCRAISELFADNALKFSFEISCGSYRELDDGTIEIDASEDNFLEGAAVVSFPACQSAVALDLVAELADDRKEGENMTDVNEAAVVAEEINAEDEKEEAIAETEESTEEAVVAETETTETAEAENAEILVTESHYESHTVEMYDTDTGESVEERVTHDTTVRTLADDESKQENADPVSETQTAEEKPAEDEKSEDETAECGKKDPEDKKCAETEAVETAEEDSTNQIAQIIAELREEIAALRTELAELKAEPEHKVVAEVAEKIVADVNPFVEDMKVSETKKYSLLESDKPVSTYTLLDRA